MKKTQEVVTLLVDVLTEIRAAIARHEQREARREEREARLDRETREQAKRERDAWAQAERLYEDRRRRHLADTRSVMGNIGANREEGIRMCYEQIMRADDGSAFVYYRANR